MIDWPSFSSAVSMLMSSWDAWIWVVPGLLIGLVCGALPGVSITMALALALPLSLQLDFLGAIIFLTSVYTGAGFGGSIPAILLNMPGAPGSVASTFDGYPMSQQGRHNEALGFALFASSVGGVFGYLVLLLLVQPLGDAVLQLGSLEMLVVAIWGLVLLGALGAKSISKGILAAAFGVLLGTIGMNTAGYMRGTMGIPSLIDGISTIPAMIGMLAAGQLLGMAGQEYVSQSTESRDISWRRIVSGYWGVLRFPSTLLRGSFVGALVGAAPGIGSSVASLLSYGAAKRASKKPDEFGKGSSEGLIAAESSVASAEGGSMATMLALGIPGSGATAVLLASFGMHNVVAGPSFMDQQRDMVYAIILSNMVQAALLLLVGLIFIYFAARVIKLRTKYILPLIFMVAIMGAVSTDNSSTGPITLAIFAVVGYVLTKAEYPVAAVVVGLLLGGIIETQALRTWQLANGNLGFVLERPIALGLVMAIAFSMLLSAWSKRRNSNGKA